MAISTTINQLGGKSNPITKLRRENGNGPRLELKLNLSPARGVEPEVDSDSRSTTASPISLPSSYLSSEEDLEDAQLQFSSSLEATSMMVVGCPRCLMYVLLSQYNPKCSKCQSTALLEFGDHSKNTKNG